MPRPPQVLFFDVNGTLLDLAPLQTSVAQALSEREEAAKLWFTTMLQYALVDSAVQKYHSFDQIGIATLQMIAKNYDIHLSKEDAQEVLSPIHSLQPHSEVPDALNKLKKAGYQLITLTNSSSNVLKDQIKNAGLSSFFGYNWSVEDIGVYKPHLKVYQWAAQRFGADARDCMLIAAHGWDIAGALWAGWRATFISRPGHQPYPLAPQPELTTPDLTGVADYLVELSS